MRKAVVIGLAFALALSVVSPAFGGPSPLAVAKKALRVATKTKKQLDRSYNRTHPTEIISVDGGERTAQPFDFAQWEIDCPRGGTVAGTSIGYGALEPTSDLSYGDGAIISLFNPSTTTPYSGSAVVHCVWATYDNQAAASTMSRGEALRKTREAQQDALEAARH
jgi:hypothetical protein